MSTAAAGDVRQHSVIRRSFGLLVVASLLAAAWWIALATITIFFANPVTVNRAQILQSDEIVTARVADARAGRIEVEKAWKKGKLAGVVTVSGLADRGAVDGETYIIPLTRSGDAFEVARTPISDTSRLIYPAIPEAVAQIDAILKDPD